MVKTRKDSTMVTAFRKVVTIDAKKIYKDKNFNNCSIEKFDKDKLLVSKITSLPMAKQSPRLKQQRLTEANKALTCN